MAKDTFYCPYAARSLPKQESTIEHIFPLAIGGTGDFTLPVSRKLNHVVGSKVDGRFVNQTLIAAFRTCYKLHGHSATPPELRAQIDVEVPYVGRKRVDVRVSKDEVKYKLPPSRTPIVDNKSHWIGDREDLDKMFRAEEKRARKRGQRVERFIEKKITIDLPPTLSADGLGLTCSRFMAKVAFATFYRTFGLWSLGSPEMNALRRLFLDPTDSDEAYALAHNLVAVRMCDEQDVVFEIEKEFPDSHTVWIVFARGGVLAYVSMFGVLVGRVIIARPGAFRITDHDRLIIVDYKRRHCVERQPEDDHRRIKRLYSQSTPGQWFRE